jgi:hypothetical protein
MRTRPRCFASPLSFLTSCAAATGLALWCAPASAVGTRTFDLDTLDKLSGGDLKGVAVSSDGRVRPGFTLGSVPLPDVSAAYAALPMPDGSVLVGTGPTGKILRVAGDQASVFAETKATWVTSMVLGANGVVYAATMPDGVIFKVTSGKAEQLAKLPDVHHVWALAWDKARTALYAATGGEARVFRVGLDGSTSVYFTTDEPNLVSLAVADDGTVYAGSQGKGLLYKITGPGRATVVEDFAQDEVKAIAIGKDGALFVAANEYGEAPEVPHRSPAAARNPAGPVSAPRPKPGKGTLYAIDAKGRVEKRMHHDDTHYASLAVGDDGQPYVGTGAEGRVYTVDEAHVVTLVCDTDERQVSALRIGGPHPFVVASDPAVFHRVLARGGADAVWTSKVLDAGLRAKFGIVSWRATGPLEVSTRSGNTQTPDATWSPWSNPLGAPAKVASPDARFVQVRARWRDASAVLGEVVLPFVTENARPVVLDVTAAAKGLPKEPLKDEKVPASGGEPAKHEATIKVTWKVDDPDNDPLRYKVTFQREGQTQWRDATEPGVEVTKTELEWDTTALPEGKYRVRVEASDAPANPPGDAMTHALESAPFTVDNTPPVVTALAMNGRILRVRVVDGVGPVVRVEVAVDGRLEWRPLAPADGVFDTADESVDADVSTLVPPGSHIVTVRAWDAAGNFASREIESR